MERAASSVEGRNFDLLHQHGLWRAFSRATMRWRAETSGPTVITPGGSLIAEALSYSRWRKNLALRAYENENLRAASCLHAESEVEAQGFRSFGLTNPIAVIPGGVPDSWLVSEGDAAEFRRRFSVPDGRRILLYLARLHPMKGMPLLLKAMARLGGELSEWILLIAGGGDAVFVRELKETARRLGLESGTRFLGPLHGDTKRDAFAAAELFVLPTHGESFGIVVAEALGAGVPVVTTHGAPWGDLVENECGWHVAATSDAIARALRGAAKLQANTLAEMGRRGMRLVSGRYTCSHVARRTITLYDWLLTRAPQPDFVVTE